MDLGRARRGERDAGHCEYPGRRRWPAGAGIHCRDVAAVNRLSMTIRTTSPSHSTDQDRPPARRIASPRSLHKAMSSPATAADRPPEAAPRQRQSPHPTTPHRGSSPAAAIAAADRPVISELNDLSASTPPAAR